VVLMTDFRLFRNRTSTTTKATAKTAAADPYICSVVRNSSTVLVSVTVDTVGTREEVGKETGSDMLDTLLELVTAAGTWTVSSTSSQSISL